MYNISRIQIDYGKVKDPRKRVREMPRATQILRKSRKVVEDLNLLKVLQSEISHELSSNSFQDESIGSLGDFVLDWNSSRSQDVVLRRKSESGEEVAVSALLSQKTYDTEGLTSKSVVLIFFNQQPFLVLPFTEVPYSALWNLNYKMHLRNIL
ncbi:hypothetical protein V6Z11_D03G068400 [Gossypium hirsutum]